MVSPAVGANRDSSHQACEAGVTAGSTSSTCSSVLSAAAGGEKIKSGNTPSTNSGASQRPHPRDRSPPKPESDSSRNADSTGARQRVFAASSANETTAQSPAPALNS